MNKKLKCECGKPAKILMKCGNSPDDWVYATCEVCWEPLCKLHAEADPDREIVCDTCYQQQVLLRLREPSNDR